MIRVLGVDGCSGGWIGISSDLSAYFAADVEALTEAARRDGPLDVLAIDIPIGLPRNGVRAADRLARRAIGARASSVFTTPVRAAVFAPDYATANDESRRRSGSGLSRQSFALGAKIREVDAWVGTTDLTVIEVHPEVSFAQLAGRSLSHRKSSWAGLEERRHLLEAVGLAPAGDLGLAGARAAPDDVLDAAVGAWTARRYALGQARALPDVPERYDGSALAAAIWA